MKWYENMTSFRNWLFGYSICSSGCSHLVSQRQSRQNCIHTERYLSRVRAHQSRWARLGLHRFFWAARVQLVHLLMRLYNACQGALQKGAPYLRYFCVCDPRSSAKLIRCLTISHHNFFTLSITTTLYQAFHNFVMQVRDSMGERWCATAGERLQ